VPQFDNGLVLDFDIDRVHALAVRRAAQWERLNSATFLTTNEKRAELGYGPVQGGDELFSE
jgi:phage portal protein BeeE